MITQSQVLSLGDGREEESQELLGQVKRAEWECEGGVASLPLARPQMGCRQGSGPASGACGVAGSQSGWGRWSPGLSLSRRHRAGEGARRGSQTKTRGKKNGEREAAPAESRSGVRRAGRRARAGPAASAAPGKAGAGRSSGDSRTRGGQGEPGSSIGISGSATLGALLTTSLPPRIKMTAGECKWLARLSCLRPLRRRLRAEARGAAADTKNRPSGGGFFPSRTPAPPEPGPGLTCAGSEGPSGPRFGNRNVGRGAENCGTAKICLWILSKCPPQLSSS